MRFVYPDIVDLAKFMYRRREESFSGHEFGDEIWEVLPDQQRRAWEEKAAAILSHLVERHRKKQERV